jgi:hypothetical protein
MKDRDKLFLETYIELENNVPKVAIEQEKACSLKAKMTSSYIIDYIFLMLGI